MLASALFIGLWRRHRPVSGSSFLWCAMLFIMRIKTRVDQIFNQNLFKFCILAIMFALVALLTSLHLLSSLMPRDSCIYPSFYFSSPCPNQSALLSFQIGTTIAGGCAPLGQLPCGNVRLIQPRVFLFRAWTLLLICEKLILDARTPCRLCASVLFFFTRS